jgi:nucleotide-binding universal stress UspA family protein
MPPIRTILAPIDFTEPAEQALDYAIDLAKQLGASVLVLHAHEIPVYGFPDAALIAPPDVAKRIADAAKAGLDAALERRAGCGVKLTGMLREGPPWEVIEEVAKSAGADLIIMGTHGRRGLARALLGSVAERVIRTSTRPVLTVHAPRAT